MYLYESHLGGLFLSLVELDYESRYCDQCGDSDWLIAKYDNKLKLFIETYRYGRRCWYFKDIIKEFLKLCKDEKRLKVRVLKW